MTGQQRFFAVLFYAAIFLGLASVIIDIVNEISNVIDYRKRFSKRLRPASCCVCRRLTRTIIICQEDDMGVHV